MTPSSVLNCSVIKCRKFLLIADLNTKHVLIHEIDEFLACGNLLHCFSQSLYNVVGCLERNRKSTPCSTTNIDTLFFEGGDIGIQRNALIGEDGDGSDFPAST